MYKVKDPYQGSILTLNLMELEQARKIRFSFGEVVAIIIPFVAIALIFLGDFFPGFDIVAYCTNVSGGDICHFAAE